MQRIWIEKYPIIIENGKKKKVFSFHFTMAFYIITVPYCSLPSSTALRYTTGNSTLTHWSRPKNSKSMHKTNVHCNYGCIDQEMPANLSW